MRPLFTVVLVFGAIYFAFARRRFDFFSVAFVGGGIYFLPGFFGVLRTPTVSGPRRMTPLVDEAYVVMILVVVALTVGALVFDNLPLHAWMRRHDAADAATPRHRSRPGSVESTGAHAVMSSATSSTVAGRAAVVATVLAAVGLVVTATTAGSALFSVEKQAMMEQLDRWHILWVFSASVGAVLAWEVRSWRLFLPCLGMLLFDLFIGFRVSLAMTFVAVVTLALSDRGQMSLVSLPWRVVAGAVLVGFGFFVYKPLYLLVKSGQLGRVADRLFDPTLYGFAITNSEPFTIQVILNETLRNDFRVGMAHLTDALFQLIPFSNELGARIQTFNDLFQPTFFPFHEAGMAHNIWAQMWSAGGWLLLLIFLGIFVISLAAGSILLRSHRPFLRAGTGLLWSYWAFYIYRNDLAFQLNLEKRVLGVLLVCGLVAYVVTVATGGRPRMELRPGET